MLGSIGHAATSINGNNAITQPMHTQDSRTTLSPVNANEAHQNQVHCPDDDDCDDDPPSADERAHNAETRQAALYKRRRVTRACDECRRKKIKCDGKQPCTHCTIFTYECSYDQPSTRRRNPGPHYIEGLENKIRKAEALLKVVLPNLDGLDDPAIDLVIRKGCLPDIGPGDREKAQNSSTSSDTNLESMVNAVGSIELDETGMWDYSGHSSGLNFMRRVREQLGDAISSPIAAMPALSSRSPTSLESPRPATNSAASESPMELQNGNFGNPLPVNLPTMEAARVMCRNAVSEVAVLLRVVHEPTFWASFDRIYSIPPTQYADEDHRFLPLLYSTLAVGVVYGNEQDNTYQATIESGTQFFKAARQLMDVADCRDLAAIQAIIFIIYFLQCSAKLSTCYAYVGIALRSALRMGLHRSINKGFNPLECEMRKRVFWTIRKLDIYMAVMLGLPQTLIDQDIDQEYPIEVDDEYVTVDGIATMPEGSVSFMTAYNVHTNISKILAKVNRLVYPVRPSDDQPDSGDSYTVPFSVITDIEKDLEDWKRNLPPGLSPANHDPRLVRTQQMLRLAYAFVQSLLYRPFLHFVGSAKRSQQVDGRATACAMSYVNVSRNLVHLAVQMKQKNLLNGAFWVIMYMTYFSIMSLVYFAAENSDSPAIAGLLKDAFEGRAVLKAFSKRSMAADRCTATLDVVFKGLPEWMRTGRVAPVISKKRRQDESSKLIKSGRGDTASQSPSAAIPPPSDIRSELPAPPRSIPGPGFNGPQPGLGHNSAQNGPHLPVQTHPATFSHDWQQNMGDGYLYYQQQQAHQHRLNAPPMDLSHHPVIANHSPIGLPLAHEPFPYVNQALPATWEDTWDARQVSTPLSVGLPDFHGSQYETHSALTSPTSFPTQDSVHTHSPGHGHVGTSVPWAGHMMAPQSGILSPSSQQVQQQQQQHQQPHLQQAQSFPEVNLNGIFGGGEWNSMPMDQGYRH